MIGRSFDSGKSESGSVDRFDIYRDSTHPERAQVPSHLSIDTGPFSVRRHKKDHLRILQIDRPDGVPDRSRRSGYFGTLQFRKEQRRVRDDRAGYYGQELHPIGDATRGNERLGFASRPRLTRRPSR